MAQVCFWPIGLRLSWVFLADKRGIIIILSSEATARSTSRFFCSAGTENDHHFHVASVSFWRFATWMFRLLVANGLWCLPSWELIVCYFRGSTCCLLRCPRLVWMFAIAPCFEWVQPMFIHPKRNQFVPDRPMTTSKPWKMQVLHPPTYCLVRTITPKKRRFSQFPWYWLTTQFSSCFFFVWDLTWTS